MKKNKKYLLVPLLFLIFSFVLSEKVSAYKGPIFTASISSSLVYPNGVTQYNFVVNADALYGLGAQNTDEVYLIINGLGDNEGLYRGVIAWAADSNIFAGNKDNQECDGLGGFAAIASLPPEDVYGHEYIELDNCNVTGLGDVLTLTYVVRFNPPYLTDGPQTENDLALFAHERTYDKTTDFVLINTSFALSSSLPPGKPGIVGDAEVILNTNHDYTFTSTDPAGEDIRYGVDWDMDGTADEWLPSGVTYVDSGVPKTATHSWITTGANYFQVLAQNYLGLNSVWEVFEVDVNNGPVDGVCGPANRVYSTSATDFEGDPLCALGDSSSSPAFPSPGNSVSWTCLGSDGGADSPQCTASVSSGTYSLTVSTGPVYGGIIRSEDNSIDCGVVCSALFNEGETVTLTAVPQSSNWRFTGWSGDGCSGTGLCIINVALDTIISALFSPRAFQQIEF